MPEDLMIGGFYFTPFDPAGRVKLLRVYPGEYDRKMADVRFCHDHAGYPKDSTGTYFADELRPAQRRIIVVNARSIPDATACLYIGRAMPGRPGSPLGNPFKIKRESERPEALQRYREWLDEQMESDTEARREIYRIADLATCWDLAPSDFALVCWCAPKQCHGDVIKEVVERIIKEREQ